MQIPTVTPEARLSHQQLEWTAGVGVRSSNEELDRYRWDTFQAI